MDLVSIQPIKNNIQLRKKEHFFKLKLKKLSKKIWNVEILLFPIIKWSISPKQKLKN